MSSSSKTPFVLPTETAKMARALDGISATDRQFVAEMITYLGSDVLDTVVVEVAKEAGLLSMRFERMSEPERNVIKGTVSVIMAKNKDRTKSDSP